MLTSVSNLTPRARALHARGTAMRALGSASGCSVVLRPQQQTRAFRFGWWCANLDPEIRHELRRRYRSLRHKHAASLNRKLSWEQHPDADEAKQAFRRVVGHYWHAQGWTPRGRSACSSSAGASSGSGFGSSSNSDSSANGGKPNKTPDNPTGVRPGQNIEDVERGAMNHLLFGDRDRNTDPTKAYEYDHWASPFKNIRDYIAHQQARMINDAGLDGDAVFYQVRGRQPAASNPAPAAQPGNGTEDYVIDPITNRKVPKTSRKAASDSVEIPAASFKAYRSQFSQFEAPKAAKSESKQPIFYDGAPPESELRQYGKVAIDEDTPEVNKGRAAALAGEDADFPASSEELQKYRRVKIDSVTDKTQPSQPIAPSTAAELRKYRQVELDAKPSDATAGQTGATFVPSTHWPAEKKRVPVLESEEYVQNHDTVFPGEHSSRKSNGVVWHSDDAFTSHTGSPVSEGVPPYDDLHKYKPAMGPEPVISDYPAPTPEELRQYNKPVRYNEPDGKPPGYVEKETYDDLHLYKPFKYNEPDGKPPGYVEDTGYDPAELQKYSKAFMWNEPDGQPMTATEPEPVDPAEMQKYNKAVKYNEPDGKPPGTTEETHDASELSKYASPSYYRADNPSPVETTSEDARDPSELAKYKPVRYNEPDGKPEAQADSVAESLKEFDAAPGNSWVTQGFSSPESSDESYVQIQERLRRLCKDAEENKAEDSGLERQAAAKNEASGGKSHHRWSMLESLMSRLEVASDAVDKEASDAVKSVKSEAQVLENNQATAPTKKVTGNFVKDFPEEFGGAWTAVEDSSKTILQPKKDADAAQAEAEIQRQEREYAEGFATPEGVTKLVPSRYQQSKESKSLSETERRRIAADPYSKEPQGLETSYVEECGGKPPSDTYVKIFTGNKSKTEDNNSASTSAEPAASEKSEPAVYKILAYDPMMQKINMAETTSIVPDTASALTPAEVLLRLSNPSKFFPHFKPLQAQGFEIVSGSGDVLIFRKVREAAADVQPSSEAASSATESPTLKAAPVNPIDMTGTRHMAPASANFASPTGYVNYDLPRFDGDSASTRLPPPPAAARFRSNIDVRREEPVFSGPKSTAGTGAAQGGTGADKAEAKSLGKRVVVGAVWVAGISYALGVVGEYFKTGGADGMGPKGL